MSLFQTVVRRNKPKRNVNIVAGNMQNSVFAIDKKGKVWAWGYGGSGVLGDNTIVSKSTPVSVAGVVKTFCKIASGGNNTALAIDKNGRAWSWGGNNGGSLGDNSVIAKSTPVSVCGTIKTFCEIALGQTSSHAIDKNGRVWSWGANFTGVLGDNTIVSKSTPVSVLGTVKTFCKISAGDQNFVVAIDKNGRLWSWGNGSNGQLGDNTLVSKSTPVSVAGAIKTFCKISCAGQSTSAIDKNGRVWSWGFNFVGVLGDNTIVAKSTPIAIAGTLKTFCEISTGYYHVIAIDKNGRLWGWGQNIYGNLGDNTLINRSTPVSVCGTIKTFCKIGTSQYTSFAIDKNARLWSWGQNIFGQIGNNNVDTQKTPVNIHKTERTFCEITAAYQNSLGIDKNGKVWGWGFNANGSLGINDTNNPIYPVSVAGINKTFCKISTSDLHSLAIDKNGRAWSWGNNAQGQLGDNTIANKSTPVSVLGAVKTFCQISAGKFSCGFFIQVNESFSIAIDKNGKVWGWGSNFIGQLGNNTTVSTRTPVSIAGTNKTFCQISIGTGISFCVAIDKNGRAWSWGGNNSGSLGDNTTTNKSTPVSVAGAIKTFCKISSGLLSSVVAIDKNGRAWSWGNNAQGQLGDNTIANKSTPVSVLGAVKTFCQISGGNGSSFCVAIDKNGRAWSWGNNTQGQLGDNTLVNKSTPVSVAGTVKTFCKISAGSAHVLAIDKNGRLWGWGYNRFYQLGIPYTVTPVQVCNI